MAGAIVGREAELDAVERFLDTLTTGPAALVIDGEAGIGKTTVWLEGVRSAESRFFRVLQARPAESEAKLSYAALADLIGGAFDETHTALPAPQERALATALLRAETNEPADARTTATALVGVLTALAADRPLLVAIDDVQWLDPASARALEFAACRLPPRLGLLLTRRAETPGEAPLGLGHALPDDRLDVCVRGPLSLAALHHNTLGNASGAGNDQLIGGRADDALFGDSSADGTVTAAGNDTLVGLGGNDTLFSDNVNFAGTATVETMGGKDLLDAGDGVDTLRAGPANDLLNGGPGSPDDCDGEAGIDTAKSCEILTGVP